MTGFGGLRIGLVGPLPPPAGGMANQTRQLAELLGAAQATVCLVQTNAPYRPAWAGHLPGLRALFRLLPYLHALWRAAGCCDLFHVMANSGWSWHLFAAPAIWVAWLRRVPVVVNYRGGEASHFLTRSQALVKCSMRHVAALAVPSDFLAHVFGRHGMPSEVVPNVVDLARFQPRADGSEGHAQLLVARNLEPIYDNATALRAFGLVLRERPDARLTIAGSGPQEHELRALAAHLGVQNEVHFAGRLERDAMAGAYRAADVSLNPSQDDNMQNSVLDSMDRAVPLDSTNVGGVPFIVTHEHTALLVPPGDAQAMANAVLRLLQDRALRLSLVRAGLVDVQRYTWSEVAPRLAAVYRTALGRT